MCNPFPCFKGRTVTWKTENDTTVYKLDSFFLRTHHRGTKQCFSNHHIFLFKTADINDCLQCKERISCVSILPAIITLLLAWQWKYSITEQRPNLQQGLNVSSPNPTIDNTVIMALCEASVRLRSYLIINAVWTLWWPWDQSALLYNRITRTGQLSLPFFDCDTQRELYPKYGGTVE